MNVFRIRYHGHTYRLSHVFDLDVGERAQVVPRSLLRSALLARANAIDSPLPALKRAWAERTLSSPRQPALADLLQAVDRGVLVAVQEKGITWRLTPPADLEPPKQEDTQTDPTTWVELKFEDDDGNPVAHHRYRIKLPDGSVREGVSGKDGTIRFDGIPSGSCELSSPGVDAELWMVA